MPFKFDQRIQDAMQEIYDAKSKYDLVVAEVQEQCEHPVIHYQEGYYSEIGGRWKSFVSCTNCGLTYYDHYKEYGPFGRRDDLNRPLQPKKMDYHEALGYQKGNPHNKFE